MVDPTEEVVTSMRANFTSPSSFLTMHHTEPGDERDAFGTEASHRDATWHQVATSPFESPDTAAAPATGQPPRK
jgi:hypothetical protein